MDGFERRSAGKPAASAKKYAIVGALAVALAGVLAFNWMHSQPRTAEAGVMENATAAAVGDATAAPGESPAQAIELLAHDPTANLLRGGEDKLKYLDEPPGNPFALSKEWRGTLVKPEPVHTVVNATPQVVRTIETPKGPVYDTSMLKVEGMFRDASRMYVILNGKIVTTGAVVAGARIVEITEDHLVCQPVGQADAARFELPLKPK